MRKFSDQISYFLKNAPLAIITSSLPGFINYAAILFLTMEFAAEDVGHYRLFLSYFALLGLCSLLESSKVQIRAQVSGDMSVTSNLFLLRIIIMAIVAIGICSLWVLGLIIEQKIIPDYLAIISIFSFFAYPADLYLSYLQGERKFPMLAGVTFIKYIICLIAFVAQMMLSQSVIIATLSQIFLMAAFNVFFCFYWMGDTIKQHARSFLRKPVHIIKSVYTKESFTLSLANWLPSSLEHIDKMLIGYLFGLEALGIYTLAFSTGRFIYNSLKPAFYIYYRHFVQFMPGKKVLGAVFLAFTVFGAFLSLAFGISLEYFSFMEKFKSGAYVVYILFLSYGVAMADAVFSQSYGINKKAISSHLLISNTSISSFCLVLFSLCFWTDAKTGMIICALHYPLRHFGTIVVLWILKKRSLDKALPETTHSES